MFRILYDTALQTYQIGAHVAALFSPKARKWVDGRKAQDLTSLNLNKPVWIHCSSLGEFEQGRPIIERIKQQHPQQQILLTFFRRVDMKFARTMIKWIVYCTCRWIRK